MSLTLLAVSMAENATNLSALQDEDVLSLVAQRNEAALRVMYDRYRELTYSVALRITGDHQTAEEVVQDAFHSAWQSADKFRSETGTVSRWLLNIAHHRAIDIMRSKRERVRLYEQRLDAVETANGPPNLNEEIAQRLLRERMRQALDSLPSNQRQAIELAYYRDMTQAEIAQQLGESLSTVKTRLRLGLLTLRHVLHLLEGAAPNDK